MTLIDLKNHFSQELSGLYSKSEKDFMFYIFAEHILNQEAFRIKLNLYQPITHEQLGIFSEIINELKSGKPYQYILGKVEFYGLQFFVDEHVLIPRPETEELLELAIKEIRNSEIGRRESKIKILDIGTGSGIIPIILKKYFPQAEVSSIDFSDKALKIAKKNACEHQVNINFIHQDYLSFEPKEIYDVIISNPPYIGNNEELEIENSVKNFEPKMALFSPTDDALVFYKKIAQDSKTYLSKNGKLFLEINQKLGNETLALFSDFENAKLIKDLSGNDRFIIF